MLLLPLSYLTGAICMLPAPPKSYMMWSDASAAGTEKRETAGGEVITKHPTQSSGVW